MADARYAEIPAHVPPDLVFEFDYFEAPQGTDMPHEALADRLHALPDIFFTPCNGGHWVVTRVDDAREVYRRYEDFSVDPIFNVQRRALPRFAPLQYDPPVHGEQRAIVSKVFSPKRTQEKERYIRELARRLIGDVYPRGECEFVSEVAQLFPVTIFLEMAGAPQDDRAWLIAQAEQYLRNPDLSERARAKNVIGDYLGRLLAQKRRSPSDDLLSGIEFGHTGERELTPDEKLGMATMFFFAGLDTTVALLSFVIHFLGRSPGHYDQLKRDPDRLVRNLEEIIRVHGTNSVERGVARDIDFRDVRMKAHDRIVVFTPVLGLDENQTPNARVVDFDRDVSVHLAFGAATHRCMGSHLARLELRVFVEEWMARLPAYQVGPTEMQAGVVLAPSRMPICWDVKE